MLSSVVFLSYAVAATAFLLLSILLMTKWRGRLHWISLLVACIITSVWATNIALHGFTDTPLSIFSDCLEVLRGAAWIVFLLILLDPSQKLTLNSLANISKTKPYVLIILIFHALHQQCVFQFADALQLSITTVMECLLCPKEKYFLSK